MKANVNAYFYCPQRSWGKVIFSQACVILFMGGGSASVHAGIPPPRSRHPPLGPGTPSPPWEQAHPQQAPPPEAEHAGRYSQRTGGTHPTGMQSFFFNSCRCSVTMWTLNWILYEPTWKWFDFCFRFYVNINEPLRIHLHREKAIWKAKNFNNFANFTLNLLRTLEKSVLTKHSFNANRFIYTE